MKIRGSESDISVWNLKPFPVGTAFWLPLKKTKTLISYKKVSVKVPLRLSPMMLDLSRFVPTGVEVREHGAGEITIAINSYLSATIELRKGKKDKVSGTKRKSVILHAIKLYKKSIKKEFSVIVNITFDDDLSHVGLGTTPALYTSVLYGINHLCGDYLTNRELSQLITYNYGEEVVDNDAMLVPGISTGGAFWSCLNGGINVTSGDFANIFSAKLESDLDIIIGIPQLKKKQWADGGYEIPVMDLLRKYERFDAGKACHWILMKLLPAILDNNIKKIGEIFWDTTFDIGNKAIVPILNHGTYTSFNLLMELYSYQVDGGFVSSAGPLICCFDSNHKTEKTIISLFKKYLIVPKKMKIDNAGLILKEIKA